MLPDIIMLPGMGADYRLFAPQIAAFENLTVPSWIPPNSDETLSHYAARIAETITPKGPYIIGGVSFGGMIAHELAVHLARRTNRPRGLILISSCRSRKGLRCWYRSLAPIANCLPVLSFNIAKFASPYATMFLNRLPMDIRKLLVGMFRDADSHFMKWALSALLHWQPPSAADIPTLHIHGRRDRLISIRNVTPNRVIEDGGHFINLTHSEQVNGLIREMLSK